jgi:hypothetical protein
MSTISNIGKIAYVYDAASDTWHPVAGMTDSSSDFYWTGDHSFSGAVSVDNSFDITGNSLLNGSLNFFTSEAQRDTVLTSTSNGKFAMVVGINAVQPQYYYNGQWRLFGSNAFLVERSTSHTLQISDAGKTIDITSSNSVVITVPKNSNVEFPIGSQIAFIQSAAGQISFVGEAGVPTSVIINSKNNNKKTSAQFTQSLLVKKAENTWYLFGDLTA